MKITAQQKKYAITAFVALAAIALVNRVPAAEPVRKLIYG